MKQIMLKKYLVGALSFIFVFVLGLAVWTGLGRTVKASAADSYSLKFVDTTYIETLSSVNVNGNGSGSLVTDEAISGKAVKIAAADTSAYPYFRVFENNAVTAGEVYHIRFKIKGNGTAVHLWQHLAYYELIDDWIWANNEWVECSYDYVVQHTSSENVMLHFQTASVPGGGGVYYIEDFSVEKTKTVASGSAIGALPALDAGKAWAIDGQQITSETIWNYTEDKTATAVSFNTLTFDSNVNVDKIESMTASDFGVVYNGTGEITETNAYNGKALKFTVGTANTGSPASPWIRLSSSTLPAGNYVVQFKMRNSKYVNISYEVGAVYGSNMIALQNNVSNKADWTEYEYPISLTSDASSLYLLVNAHPGAGEVYIDDLVLVSEAAIETKSVICGAKIGELPALSDGYVWTIDGEIITSETIYSYTEDKTAVPAKAHALTFEYPDMLESMTSGSFGVVYNGTGAITDGVLTFTTGSADLAKGASPWICLSSTPLSAGDYLVTFKMKNALWVNVSYEAGTLTYNGTMLKANNSPQADWTEHEYVITLTEQVSSLYLLTQTHAPSSAGKYTVSFDDLTFVAKNDAVKYYIPNQAMELPALSDGYYWTIDGKKVENGALYTYNGDKTAVAENEVLYTLTFEGVETRSVKYGEAIGTLPAIPSQYTNGKWTIDGMEITASTIYNYTEDKTAVIRYDKEHSLRFVLPDMVDSMTSSDFGAVYNATGAITDGVLNFTTGSASTTAGGSPWVRLSATTVAAGDYTVRFKMKNELWVNLSYEIGGHTFSGNTALKNNVSIQNGWVEYEFTISLADNASSLYLLLGTHKPGSAGNYTISIDDLVFATASRPLTRYFFGDESPIGALPAIPEKAGYVNGRWTIDGEVITENTIFNYGEDKVAELMYDSYYMLSFAMPDFIDGMTASDFGSEYNATGVITDGVLNFTTGSASTTAGGSPWVRLSATTLAAGNYTLRFKMKNALWVNLSYQVGGHTFTGNVALKNNISVQSGWVEYEYTINLTSNASSLYFLIATHTPGSAGNYTISIDDLKFYSSSKSYEDKQLTIGEKIGTLPEVPERDGYRGYWTIDGEEITKDTVWRYTEEKVAVIAYKPTRFTLTFGYPIGMEDGELVTSGWNVGAVGTREFVEEGVLYGSALKYTIAQTGTNGAYIAKVFSSALVSGKTYTFSYWMNITESNSLEMSVFVENYGDNFTDAVSGVTNGWVYRSRTFTATADGNFVVYFRAGHGSGGNGTVYIDEIYLREAIGDPQSVTVNIGEAIGTLPAVPTISGETGAGRWVVDGKIINADTIWTYEGDVMATFTFVPVYTITFSGTTKTLAVGDTVGALPTVPVKDGYIGYWVVNGARITSDTIWTIEANATATVEYEIDLGVNVVFEWVEGAAVRVANDGKSGIRFETHLNKASYDALETKYGAESIETGTFILPYAKLGGRSLYAFVTDSANVAGKDYIKVVNNGWKNRATAEKDGYYQWYGSLVNIKEQNYSLNFVGVGYVKVTVDGEEILILAGEASTENSRSIYHVSYKAYADVNNGLDSDGMDVLEDYLNGIATFVSQGSGVVMDTTLADRGYTATYTLTKSGSTENYVVTAPEGKTINSLVVNNVAFRVTPANIIYFSYYNGSVMVLADDESNAMNASIITANGLANSVQATYTDADWTAYRVVNQGMSLTHGLKEGNIQVTSLANSKGVNYLENTLDAYVVSNGTRVYGQTGSNSYGGTESGSARVNTTNLGYYYYETNVRDITFNSSIPLYLSKTYHVYPDKIHQEFTVVANGTTSSGLTDLGFEMKIPVSKVAKYTIDGTVGSNETNVKEYVGFDISGVGVVGIIVAGDEVRVTVENDGTNYIVRQEKAFTNILSKAEQPTKEEVEAKTAEYVALTSENQFNMWNRLYTDETHAFNGIAAANAEEQAPLSKGNISVESMDGGKFIGYDYASGSYKFAINSRGFNDAYDNYPNKHDKANISITGATSDRTIYISVEGDHALEGAAIMDYNQVLLPMPVQVGKNFQTEYEEPIYDPTDSQWGISITPIRVEKHKDRMFTVLHAMQNWGDYGLKQISSISYYISYYHLSTGVTETTCIAPYFSYSNVYGSFENAWILPDFRGGDTMHEGEPQYDSSGTMMGVSNGASNGMGSTYYGTDLGVYVGSEINSSGLTLADIDYSYVSEDGAYEYTYRQVEMPQTDEARTYYTVSLSFLKDTTIDNKAFNLLGWSSRNAKFSSYEYLDANGNSVTGSCPTKAYTGNIFNRKTVQTIYPLYKGSSYFSVYNSSTTEQNGSFGLVVKDYAITVSGANSNLGLAFKSDYFGGSNENFAGLTLEASTSFKAGDTITVNVILLPYDKAATTAANVRKVYQDSAINPLTLTATTGSVVADTWVGTVAAKSNEAQFTVSGGVDTTDALGDGADTVNYTLKVTNCTKLGKLVVEEYVGGAWVAYELGPVNGYDGYSVEREVDGTFTYSFVIAKSTADRTFRVSF